MKATTKTKQANVNINLADATITNVEVSPLGVTLGGKEITGEGVSDANIAIHFIDGTVVNSVSSYIATNSNRIKLLYPEVIQIEKVDYVTINGQKVKLP